MSPENITANLRRIAKNHDGLSSSGALDSMMHLVSDQLGSSGKSFDYSAWQILQACRRHFMGSVDDAESTNTHIHQSHPNSSLLLPSHSSNTHTLDDAAVGGAAPSSPAANPPVSSMYNFPPQRSAPSTLLITPSNDLLQVDPSSSIASTTQLNNLDKLLQDVPSQWGAGVFDSTEASPMDMHHQQWLESNTPYDMASPVGSSSDDKQLTPSNNSIRSGRNEGYPENSLVDVIDTTAAIAQAHASEVTLIHSLKNLSFDERLVSNPSSLIAINHTALHPLSHHSSFSNVQTCRKQSTQSSGSYAEPVYSTNLDPLSRGPPHNIADASSYQVMDNSTTSDLFTTFYTGNQPSKKAPAPVQSYQQQKNFGELNHRKAHNARIRPIHNSDKANHMPTMRLPTNSSETEMHRVALSAANRNDAGIRCNAKYATANTSKDNKKGHTDSNKGKSVTLPLRASVKPACNKATAATTLSKHLPFTLDTNVPLDRTFATTSLNLQLPYSDCLEWLIQNCKNIYNVLTNKLEEIGFPDAAIHVSEAFLLVIKLDRDLAASKSLPIQDKSVDNRGENISNAPNSPAATSSRSNSHMATGAGGLKFGVTNMLAHPDEFKNPSSFLKIYGDPLCGSSNLPQRGIDGNWACKRCRNLNYPRRFKCNKCRKIRDEEGDRIVAEYTNLVYQHHSLKFKTVGKANDSSADDLLKSWS